MFWLKLKLAFYLGLFSGRVFLTGISQWWHSLFQKHAPLIVVLPVLILVTAGWLNQLNANRNPTPALDTTISGASSAHQELVVEINQFLEEINRDGGVEFQTITQGSEEYLAAIAAYQAWIESEPAGWQVLLGGAILAASRDRVEEAGELLTQAKKAYYLGENSL